MTATGENGSAMPGTEVSIIFYIICTIYVCAKQKTNSDNLTFLTSSSADSNRDKDKNFTTYLIFYFID